MSEGAWYGNPLTISRAAMVAPTLLISNHDFQVLCNILWKPDGAHECDQPPNPKP